MRIFLMVLIVSVPISSYCWGFWAHKQINRLAVFTLPPEMIEFYKYNIEYITEHAVDPDKRRYAMEGEAQKHFIDLDHFCTFPCDSFPRDWNAAVETYSEDSLQAYGIVPWVIEQYCYRLTKAFEARDGKKILKYSADLGHYIGDSHVPLHTTENYNGQLTNQKGIHGFWESRLPELFNADYDFFVGKASYISDINSFVWENILLAHGKMETVLLEERKLDASYSTDQKYSFETRGQSTVRTYSESYSKAYHVALNGMVEKHMQLSIKHVGDLWFTCWVNAGQPNLNEANFHLDEKEEKKSSFTRKRFVSREHASDGLHIFAPSSVEIGSP